MVRAISAGELDRTLDWIGGLIVLGMKGLQLGKSPDLFSYR